MPARVSPRNEILVTDGHINALGTRGVVVRSIGLVGTAEVGGESVLAAGQEASGLGDTAGRNREGAVAEGRTSSVSRDGERSLGALSAVVVVILALVILILVLIVVTVVLARVSGVSGVLLVVLVMGLGVVITRLSSSARGLQIQLAAEM